MEITAEMVKELRNATGVQMMVCKEALKETDGDMEKAKLFLRKKGIQLSERREGKEVNAGIIYTYNHDNRVGVIVELKCETDFVAKNEEFQNLAKIIAMHIAWAKPIAVDEEGVHPDIEAEQEEIASFQVPEGKEKFADKIIEGKMRKFYEESCLLNQKEMQVSEGQTTIGDMMKELSGKLTEKIKVTRFVRFEIGEDIEV